MDQDYRICPSCEEEFTLSVTECPDCHVSLAFPDGEATPSAPPAFPEKAELRCVRVGPLPWTRALSDKLTEAGIAHRVETDTRSEEEGGVDPRRFGGEDLYGTWVRPEEAEAAGVIDTEIFAPLEVDQAPDAAADEACPACGAALPAEAMSCSDCGLSFG
ncbi:MAG: hypothetical protein VX252_15975 [Myxococcota bacterium]|nr:hypothetical protein [Myxococcota bacterium]